MEPNKHCIILPTDATATANVNANANVNTTATDFDNVPDDAPDKDLTGYYHFRHPYIYNKHVYSQDFSLRIKNKRQKRKNRTTPRPITHAQICFEGNPCGDCQQELLDFDREDRRERNIKLDQLKSTYCWYTYTAYFFKNECALKS